MSSLTNAEVGLTLWTVVFGLPPQNAAAAISCVPTKVARESRSVTRLEKHSFNSLKVNVSLPEISLTQRALYVMVLQQKSTVQSAQRKGQICLEYVHKNLFFLSHPKNIRFKRN